MNRIKVLFLAANPTGTSQLKLDEEIRAITEKIRASEHRDLLELVSVWAVRSDDLLQSLNMHKPHIVHFSSHGSPTGEIIVVGSNGAPQAISTQAIKALFKTLKDNIQIVVLNACYSRSQAEAITDIIDFAIGMNTAIGDQAATTFAASFYRAIGFGRSVQEAFEQGRTALLLEGILEENTPELLTKPGSDPKTCFLVRRKTDKLDLAQSQFYLDRGRERERTFAETLTRQDLWDWNPLGHAIEYYVTAIEYNPQNQHAWINLAYVFHLIGRLQEARKYLQKALELATPGPNYPGRHYKRVKKAIDNNTFLSGNPVRYRPPIPDQLREQLRQVPYLSGGFQDATISITSNNNRDTTPAIQSSLDAKKEFILSNIKRLLSDGFNDLELRDDLRLDLPKFRPAFQYITQNASKAELIAKLIDWAEQKFLMNALLEWARKRNPAMYAEHQPYWRE